jgi:hypothetical protein
VGGYDVPTDVTDGYRWYWTVGTVDGATGAFTLVNTIAEGPAVSAPMNNRDLPIK